RLRNFRAAFLAYEFREPLRQFALIGTRKGIVEHVGDDKSEYVVAEELQPLVAIAALAPRFERGNMRERLDQQVRIGELVPDARLDRRGRALGLAAALGPLLFLCGSLGRGITFMARLRRDRLVGDVLGFVFHRTILNKRDKRTATGQRQNIQACSPSAMEKKII